MTLTERGLYNITETKELLGVESRTTVYNYIKLGYLDTSWGRKSQRRYVTGKSIIKFLNAR